ncbi:MAG: polysaccharide deacetylase family protein [Flavobacteriales bacterium]|nr:MAG: polysaccharide deacetylase family protein [Flavobacteriales bacterium]
MFLAKSPSIIKKYYPRLIWDIPNDENKIYLTFDDGPIPEITEWVLGVLKQYNIKATFFCLGCNAVKHSDIYSKIIIDGHTIGNHSYHHLSGWDSDNEEYFNNVKKSNKLLNATLFRPPYGRIKKSQIIELIEDYKIIMWDVLSGDFDPKTTPEKCLSNVIKNTKSGSVIVFHDSIKASENLKYALPKSIDYLLKQDFVFDVIP